MKFKVGDRVRCTVDMYNFNTKNKKAIIKSINDGTCTIVFDEYIEGLAREHKADVPETVLELIDTFTLDDLKTGYLVELRYGELHMVMESVKGKVLIDKNDLWTDLNSYNNDFYYNNSNRNKTLDIIKVYGFSKNNSKTLRFTTENRELLWERKEILNDKEKEYLSDFIKPFRDRVQHIKKWYDNNNDKYLISAEYKDGSFPTNFPFLEEKDMYKNMEVDRAYTLEELGL